MVGYGPAIVKTVDDVEAIVGDEVTYTLTLINNSDIHVDNVVVTDPILSFFDIISATSSKGRVTNDDVTRTVAVTIDTMEPYEVITITIVALVNDTVTFMGEVPNTANLTYEIEGTASSGTSNTVCLLLEGDSEVSGAAYKTPLCLAELMFGMLGLIICGYGVWLRRREPEEKEEKEKKGWVYIVIGVVILLLSIVFYFAFVIPSLPTSPSGLIPPGCADLI